MKDIGLKRGTVCLHKHNSNWSKLFEQEREMLLKKFPETFIEISHGGSTAIPGMPAKPILDMFAAVRSLGDEAGIREELGVLGYEYRGEEGVPGRILYVKVENPGNIGTHHLQIVEQEGEEWKNHFLIKKYYLAHPEVAKEYANLKTRLSQDFAEDRPSYRGGKSEFIASVLARAKEEFE